MTDSARFTLILLIRLALVEDDAAVSDALLDCWFAMEDGEAGL